MTFSCTSRLGAVTITLTPVLDVLGGRVDDPEIPAWCTRRGWDRFLLSLDDESVARCEADGLAARLAERSDAPESLRALAEDCTRLTTLPALASEHVDLRSRALVSIKERKARQLRNLLSLLGSMAHDADRFVDVGAGHGHLTRLAAEVYHCEAIGIDRAEDRILSARALANRHAASDARPSFESMDAQEVGLDLHATDLAVGLHACGALGDVLVAAAGRARCDLVLVSCCLQKIANDRRKPLCPNGVEFERRILGLTNLTSQPHGVEVSIEETMRARQNRFALRRLLRGRGVEVAPGAEMRGVNRRRAREGFAALAERALAVHGLAPPMRPELDDCERQSRLDYAIVRRVSLARSMLARLVELAVVLDRAAYLEQLGANVLVATAFDRAVSPRNLAVFSSFVPERVAVLGRLRVSLPA